jgi:aminopeptidase N
MKKVTGFILALISSLPSFAQKPDAPIDVLNYQFEVTLSDTTNSIKGRATITARILKDATTLELDLISMDKSGKGMVAYRVLENNTPVTSMHGNDKLVIKSPKALKKGETRTFEILYEGVPLDGLIIGENRYKHRGFFADNWPNRARCWIPCIDHPADKATVEFIVIAPLHYQVVANGIQVEETVLNSETKLTRYVEQTPISPKVMVIGAADFAVQRAGEVGCIPIYSWVYPEDRDKGFYDYALAVEILPFYIKNVGPYGYKKLANVQSKTRFGGLENANTIFYSENLMDGKRSSEGTIAHEIAHQWFGNMATEAEWAHLWLSEGFATYMTILYMENKYGLDTAKKLLIEDRVQTIAFAKQKPKPIVDSSVTNYMDLLNANSYQKGGWVLHMLRSQLGDTIFWRSIREYYAQYAGKTATSEDLQKVFETVSGKNLNSFFKQWLYTPGQPDLDINWKYDQSKKVFSLTVIQKQSKLFEFPLEIQIIGGPEDGTITKSIQIKDKQTSFTLPLTSKPQRVQADPQVKLLFDGKLTELPQ